MSPNNTTAPATTSATTSATALNRRNFLAGLTAAGLGAMILPSGLFAGGTSSPSNHLRIALVGCGARSRSLILNGLAKEPDARLVVACDCFADRREKMAADVNALYGSKVCATATDYLEVVRRPDIDGVIIATTDHWHVPVAYAAALAGKDVYVEKPLIPALKWAFKLRQVVAITTAAGLLSHMPELGTCNPGCCAALAGLAPLCRQSGTYDGKRHIGGGRPEVRRILYMAALSALRRNPILKPVYRRHRANGKLPKVTITAIIRKLVERINHILKNPDFSLAT